MRGGGCQELVLGGAGGCKQKGLDNFPSPFSPHSYVSMWCGGGETAPGASFVIQGLRRRRERVPHILSPLGDSLSTGSIQSALPAPQVPAVYRGRPQGRMGVVRGLQPALHPLPLLMGGQVHCCRGVLNPLHTVPSLALVEKNCHLLSVCDACMLHGRELGDVVDYPPLHVSLLPLKLAGPNLCFVGCEYYTF